MTKRRRRKPEQIVKLLHEGAAMLSAGKSLGEVLQKLEVKESTWMRWKKQYGGMKSAEAKRLKELEIENQLLKELLAESELESFAAKFKLLRTYTAKQETVPKIYVSPKVAQAVCAALGPRF